VTISFIFSGFVVRIESGRGRERVGVLMGCCIEGDARAAGAEASGADPQEW